MLLGVVSYTVTLLCLKYLFAALIITYCLSPFCLQVLKQRDTELTEHEMENVLRHVFTLPASSCHLSSHSHTLSSSLYSVFSLSLSLFWIPSGVTIILCLFSISAWLTNSCGALGSPVKNAPSLRTAIRKTVTTGTSVFPALEHFIIETLASAVEIGCWWEAKVISVCFFFSNQPPLWLRVEFQNIPNQHLSQPYLLKRPWGFFLRWCQASKNVCRQHF